jgi:hypothetical protein
VLLFEPDREDADMFFASIFSYSQRKALCAAAYRKTRENLRRRASSLASLLAAHGLRCGPIGSRTQGRTIEDALTDPRPLNVGAARRVRQATRDLAYTLAHLERWLAAAR